MKRFETHAHTHYSNLRLLDCIIKPNLLIDRAIELGLSGISITDHDCLSGHVEINQYTQELAEEHPDFKVGLGNEIYLCQTREKKQKYYHFILLAKNEDGHRALKKLSTKAWLNSYSDRGQDRVVTTYEDLEKAVKEYPNSLIAATACLGGELSSRLLRWKEAQVIYDEDETERQEKKIRNFISWNKDLFGNDFYIECAPGLSEEQIYINKRLREVAATADLPMIVATDAHFLKKEDRYVHKAYLTSGAETEREVDSFYEFAYLQSNDEIVEHLQAATFAESEIETMFNNSIDIYNKIESYSLLSPQHVTRVKVKQYPKVKATSKYETLNKLFESDDDQDRYWVNECFNALKEKDKFNETYLTRLEEEAQTKTVISEKLGTNLFAYPNTLQHYIDMMWECGSTIGAGRGSSCSGLNHYLLGITQLDPLIYDLPWFRYLNSERLELPDIDLDLCPSKRPLIIQKIKEERREYLDQSLDPQFLEELGCTLVATFGTETTKSAILSACRGYRSADFPNGIDVDEAQYLTSLIPVERGFLWPLQDVVSGNAEKGRKPCAAFVNETNQFPGLLDIIQSIEGIICRRGSHASGVIFFEGDPCEAGCFMKTPSGDIVTQYNLHAAEAAGMTKYDFLLTEIQEKLLITIKLLQENGYIDKSLTIREVYNKYLHPDVLDETDPELWNTLNNKNVLSLFQFDSEEGSEGVRKIHPSTLQELTDTNGLIRLMGEAGEERPLDRYVRFKNDISLWYREMRMQGLTEEDQKTLEPYFLDSYGTPPSQEQMMMMLMDENICNFDLKSANAARKIVGKKKMDKIPELKKQVSSQAKNPAIGNYVWQHGIGPQMGYSFSKIHALAYSFIAVQTLYLVTYYNPIYWDCACLIVNSGLISDGTEKTSGTDYGKIASAVNTIKEAGVNFTLLNINQSEEGFVPDEDNNQIIYGFKPVTNISDDFVQNIIENRPYADMWDFVNKAKPTKSQMIPLIKGGAFDQFGDRTQLIGEYIWSQMDKKKQVNMSSVNNLLKQGLMTLTKEEDANYRFNQYLNKYCKYNNGYQLTPSALEFYSQFYDTDKLEQLDDNNFYLSKSRWSKMYNDQMIEVKTWLADNKQDILNKLNSQIFIQDFQKYASGSISKWEMDSLCFYYHDHELKDINVEKYGISSFAALPEDPEIDHYFYKGKLKLPIFKLNFICGTVLSKNKTKGNIVILTHDNKVVTVKMRKEHFAYFDKQLSEVQEDGTKKVIEKSWFQRGTMLLLQGIRRGKNFTTKKYGSSHQLYKIDSIDKNGDIMICGERRNVELCS